MPREDIAQEVLIPCLKSAAGVECMVGFFSGHSLSMIAPGLASFIANSTDGLKLLICPVLRPEDRKAISDGYISADTVIEEFLSAGLTVEDSLTKHTLRCLAYLISIDRVDIKIALMHEAIFHPKIWLIKNGLDTVAVHGSSNLTVSGLSKNFEQVSVTRSWTDENSTYVIERFESEFNRIWFKTSDECTVHDFPDALSKRLLREYSGARPPTEDELIYLVAEINSKPPERAPGFSIPDQLNYTTGDFAHQGAAVTALEAHNFRGILEMATGSGKTIAAMISAFRLFRRESKLLIIIAAPYLPLISQWCDEVAQFGLKPINLGLLSGAPARNAEVARIARRLRMNSEPAAEALVVTHDTLCDKSFQRSLARADVPIFLIADEVHNLGAAGFISSPPQGIPFRLGLSATFERQYDPEGTAALLAYFGPVVFSFKLEQAIGVCLVPYQYYLEVVELSSDEVDKWLDLTNKIKKHIRWNGGLSTEDDTILQMLLQRRRLILESAEGKLGQLERGLTSVGFSKLRNTLIYATDKDPRQLEAINSILRKAGVRFHELTSQETSSRDLTQNILQAFERGDLQVLTSKRVLDEGVNIPQISRAYILASTTVERQWTQRRGRLLRKCVAINKRSSSIHDYFVVPPRSEIDDDTRAIVKGELKRIREFARLSDNFGSSSGALPVVAPIVRQFFTDPEDAYAII